MLKQVVNELLEGTIAKTFPDDFLEEIPAQQFEETTPQVTPSAFFLQTTLLLEGSELLECLPHFSHTRTRGGDRLDDGGRHPSAREAIDSIAWTSCSRRSAPGRSVLLMT